MTFVALPRSLSTTAPGARATQFQQIQRAERDYNDLLRRLQADAAAQGTVYSPLAVLLRSIAQKCTQVLGLQTEAQILAWLGVSLPENAGSNLAVESHVPMDQLGDSLDELDGFILAAVEELALLTGEAIDGAQAEAHLRNIWQRTFARVAAAQEDFLERSFIQRGSSFVAHLYPNRDQRRRPLSIRVYTLRRSPL